MWDKAGEAEDTKVPIYGAEFMPHICQTISSVHLAQHSFLLTVPPLIQWSFHTLTQFVGMGVSRENSLSNGQGWELWTFMSSCFSLGQETLSLPGSFWWKTYWVVVTEPQLIENGWRNSETCHVRVRGPVSAFLIKNTLLSVSLIHIPTFFRITQRTAHKLTSIIIET